MRQEEIVISCKDEYQLGASIFIPDNLKAAVMITPATGIKRTFYNKFATYLLENGYGVISFNNRGISDSNKKTKNSKEASLVNWGKYDMSAVFETLKDRFPNTNYHIIGHSAGGQLVGLMDNTKDIKSLFNFASSSGSLSNMPIRFRIKATYFLNIFIPLSNLLFGKANIQWVGMGESLPKKVAQQWSRWCNGKGYVAVDFNKEIKSHQYDEIDFPSMWVHATDDHIANLENVKDMARIYSNSKITIKSLKPIDYGFEDIGHMKFFSSKRKQLWSMSIDWLEENN